MRGGLKTTRPGSSPFFSSEKKEREKKKKGTLESNKLTIVD